VDVFSTGWRQEGHPASKSLPITPHRMYFHPLLFLYSHLFSSFSWLRRTWWVGWCMDVRRGRIKGKTGFHSNAIAIFTQQTQAPANRNARSKQWQPWLAAACLPTEALAFLAVFVYATHATQAIAFEWKPGLTQIRLERWPLNQHVLNQTILIVGKLASQTKAKCMCVCMVKGLMLRVHWRSWPMLLRQTSNC